MAFIDSGVHIVKNGELITPTMKLHPDLYEIGWRTDLFYPEYKDKTYEDKDGISHTFPSLQGYYYRADNERLLGGIVSGGHAACIVDDVFALSCVYNTLYLTEVNQEDKFGFISLTDILLDKLADNYIYSDVVNKATAFYKYLKLEYYVLGNISKYSRNWQDIKKYVITNTLTNDVFEIICGQEYGEGITDLYGKYNEDVAESYKYLYDQSVEAYKNGNPYCSHPFDKCYYFCNAMTEYSKRRRNILKAFKLQGNQYFFHADKACYLKN